MAKVFQNDLVRITYERVRGYLREIFGDDFTEHDEHPVFGVVKGSALATIFIAPWGDNETVIMVRSYVIKNAQITPELMQFLLLENNDFRFGAFGIDREGNIFISHNIVGSTCDMAELKASVLAILTISDKYDDIIQSRWGGERALDRVRKTT